MLIFDFRFSDMNNRKQTWSSSRIFFRQYRRTTLLRPGSSVPHLARLPASFHADRDELLGMMRRDGILHASERQPVLSRDGTTARWMLNSLQVTLKPRGAELAGRCLLQLLARFEGRQIATSG